MENPKQRVVLVTGGNRGLGFAIVQTLADTGYLVVAAARSCTPELEQFMMENSNVAYEPLDLADRRALHQWSKNFVEKHGAPYALINNAAIAHDGVLGTMHESQIEEVIAVNVTATLLLTKYISRSMLRNRVGRIINVSSIIASTGFNGLSVYAASKAALNGFTKSLSRELGKVNITVNAVAPGYMETNMSAGINDIQLDQIRRRSALKRLAKTSEVASTVKYLLSDEAAAITGTILTVDAGNTA